MDLLQKARQEINEIDEEMAQLFPNYPQALENTAKIAQLCNVEFEFGHTILPEFKIQDGQVRLAD